VDHERLHFDAGGGSGEDDRPATTAVDDVTSRADAGVGDDTVETAQFADRLVDGGSERIEVPDVYRRGHHTSVVGPHQPCCLSQIVGRRRLVGNAGR
jgi:hypothetical protein